MNAKTKDLCNRLRGVYITPITDGAGPIDGKDHVERTFETPPISKHAADKIEELDKLLETVYEDMCGRCDGTPTRATALKLYKYFNS